MKCPDCHFENSEAARFLQQLRVRNSGDEIPKACYRFWPVFSLRRVEISFLLTNKAWRAHCRIGDMARICAMVGEHEDAIKNLDFLLSVPAKVSVAGLLNDPTWEPLKNHPGFQELIRKHRREV